MKVILAGYNVDTEVLREMKEKSGYSGPVTPETFSAAYARISRDPRTIDEIRNDARQEVEKTRRSNQAIIFKMGHHSVAEHAVFNFDIVGVSRYVMEALEKFRLCSYTEKSQRYITLDNDFVVPEEIKGTPFADEFVAMIKEQNALYHTMFAKLKDYVFETNGELAADPKKHNLLEGWAKEDARYITSLATEAQVGLTVNARNLELMLRRFASHPLAEVRELGRVMYEQVKEIAPSIILFHEANDLDKKTYGDLAAFAASFFTGKERDKTDGPQVELVQYDHDGDNRIAAALLHSVTRHSYAECVGVVREMSTQDKKELFKKSCTYVQFYDTLLREYEYAHLTYDVTCSAACFGQLKRHRMSTITTQSYDPALGITLPAAITAIGMEKEFAAVVDKTSELFYRLQKEVPAVAPYILTNAHQKRVLVQTNVRELYHIARLREDAHAQWDIRERSAAMSEQARAVLPLASMLLGGKDSFDALYKQVFG